MSMIQGAITESHIVKALSSASQKTGADFEYLLRTAERESGLKPQAKASTSSAAGLFQFIEQTWLDLVKRHGDKVGLEGLAGHIHTDSRGRHIVPDQAQKAEILALRYDVNVSSFMAGKLTRESQHQLERGLDRDVRPGELYLAHFLGAQGAVKFINASASEPQALAADQFPSAAKANKSIFYKRGGESRTMEEVYTILTKKGQGDVTHLAKLKDAEASMPLHPPTQHGDAKEHVEIIPPIRGAIIPKATAHLPVRPVIAEANPQEAVLEPASMALMREPAMMLSLLNSSPYMLDVLEAIGSKNAKPKRVAAFRQ